MSRNKLNWAGAILVICAGMMTFASHVPSVYSPYSFTVVLPAFAFAALEAPGCVIRVGSALPITLLYLLWSFVFVKPPYRIPVPASVFALIFVFLSVAYYITAYRYGVEYQGEQHTHAMYAYNAIFVLGLGVVYWLNARKPSLYSSAGFSVLLFIWLAWVAFPWLGEQM